MIGGKPSTPHIYMIAGEESGDRLGAPLMQALKRLTGGNIAFSGIGGEKMTGQGLNSLFSMDDLSVMGLAEVLPRIPRLIKRLNHVVADIRELKPDVLVTIDAPDFSFRVAQRLSNTEVRRVHYVAPTVWAWRPGRAEKISHFLDHLLTLLPFEPPYFERHGLACTYVGHPILQNGADHGDGLAFRSERGIEDDTVLLAVLPGSRESEISLHLPVFAETVARLHSDIPGLEVVIPTLAATQCLVVKGTRSWLIPVHLTNNDDDKCSAFAAANAALAASGTVALELALAGTPAVISYKMALLTGYLARRLVRTPYASLVNLILNREAVPEYLLERCRADLLSDAVRQLIDQPDLQRAQKDAYFEALTLLGHNQFDPNARAAQAVLNVLIPPSID